MMLALTKIQGLIIAAGGAALVAVAFASFGVRWRPKVRALDIPRAMRPGPSDPDLETPLLAKLQGWGVLLVVFFVFWVPLVWLQEPSQNLSQERALKTDSIARGKAAVQMFSEENQGGIGCVRCHGLQLTGSQIAAAGNVIPTPDLTTVCGGPFTGHPAIYSLNDVYTTIFQGRGNMPSWSIRYAGALDDQQIEDIVSYLLSIQKVPFGQNVCVNPDATKKALDQFGPPKIPATTNAPP